MQITIISAVSFGLGTGCGIFKKKKSGGGGSQEQTLENPDLNSYEGYSTARFQGSRAEAIQIAGQLLIDTNLNIINDGTQSSGLRLQGFGSGESYDSLQTYSHVHDPSLSMLKSVRSMLCVLSKINYVSIPEGDQTVSTQIKECLPRSASASTSSSSSSGGQGSSGSQSSSSASSKEDLGLADITWEAYVNVDKQLIVTLKYPEKGAQEWMPSLNKEVTIVVSEGASVANPFGRYFIRIKAKSDDSSTMGSTKLGLQETLPGSGETASGGHSGEWYLMQAKMVVDSGTVVGGKADQVYVAYSENSWGNDKRMAGIFDVATSTGAITKGEFVADVKGFDPESNEPGGAYRVTFNQERLHREKTISDPTEYFGPNYQGPAISTEPVKECYKINEFTRLVHGYRVFNSDGSALNEDNQGFSFATGVEETATQGYASYWGISTYSRDGMPSTPTDGTKVYKIDWMTMSNDGKPTLGTEYTIETKPGRFQKRTKSNYDLSKLDGRVLEGYGESDPVTWEWTQYKIKYNHATQSFSKVAKLSGSFDATTGVAPTWEDLATPEAVTLSESQTYYLWSPSLTGGSLQVANLPGEGLKATIENYEMFSGSHASKTLKCISGCPKVGVTVSDLQNQWSSSAFHTIDTAASAPTYTVTDFTLYDSSSQAISIDFSGVDPATSYMTSLYMELIDATEYDQIVAANPSYYPYQIREKASAIYNYQMGADSWSKTIILRESNGQVATFDPPKKLDVTLSAETERFGDSTHFGESHQLQAENGFLWVPMEQKGKFKDSITGQEWDNWVPMFALKDGLLLPDSSASPSTSYKIKAQFIESRMNTAAEEECSALVLPTTLELPESVMTQTTALRR